MGVNFLVSEAQELLAADRSSNHSAATAAIMAALHRTSCRYFVMEHDNPSDDRRFAERSIAAATRFDKETT